MKNLNYIHEVIQLKAYCLDMYADQKKPTLRQFHYDGKYIAYQDEMHSGHAENELYHYMGIGGDGKRTQTKAERKLCEHNYRVQARISQQEQR